MPRLQVRLVNRYGEAIAGEEVRILVVHQYAEARWLSMVTAPDGRATFEIIGSTIDVYVRGACAHAGARPGSEVTVCV